MVFEIAAYSLLEAPFPGRVSLLSSCCSGLSSTPPPKPPPHTPARGPQAALRAVITRALGLALGSQPLETLSPGVGTCPSHSFLDLSWVPPHTRWAHNFPCRPLSPSEGMLSNDLAGLQTQAFWSFHCLPQPLSLSHVVAMWGL